MKRVIWILPVLALLLCAGCAAPGTQLTEEETVAFDMANTYFTWAFADLGEEFFVEYEFERIESVYDDPCYCFTAKTDEKVLGYAAVVKTGETLYTRATPQAEWVEVTQEIWDIIDNSYQP